MADLIDRQALKTTMFSGKRFHYIRNLINKVPTADAVEVPTDNADSLDLAITALGIFRLSYCLNVEETDKTGNLVFRCSECEFENRKTRICSLKKFLGKYATEEQKERFSLMSR